MLLAPALISYMSDYAKGTGPSEADSIDFAKEVLYSSASVHSVVCGSRDMMEAMIQAYAARNIRAQYERVFGFDEVREAYQYVQSGKHFGKVCIELK